MPTALIDLDNRIVDDSGTIVAKYGLLVKKIHCRESLNGMTVVPNPDINLYMKKTRTNLAIWTDDGEVTGPSDQAYGWTIPDEYQSVDIDELCWAILKNSELESDSYIERLQYELSEMRTRGMYPFLRCLIYVTDTFRQNGVVWGVGRGSSCASLVLYLLGVNKIDPVQYDIPIGEFLK